MRILPHQTLTSYFIETVCKLSCACRSIRETSSDQLHFVVVQYWDIRLSVMTGDSEMLAKLLQCINWFVADLSRMGLHSQVRSHVLLAQFSEGLIYWRPELKIRFRVIDESDCMSDLYSLILVLNCCRFMELVGLTLISFVSKECRSDVIREACFKLD